MTNGIEKKGIKILSSVARCYFSVLYHSSKNGSVSYFTLSWSPFIWRDAHFIAFSNYKTFGLKVFFVFYNVKGNDREGLSFRMLYPLFPFL
jgi:hypothetical protein